MDLTGAKLFNGALLPEHAIQTVWPRLQPVLSVAAFKGLFLFGIPLVGQVPDPVTGRRQMLTDELLQHYLERAVLQAETESQTWITPVAVQERHPWDSHRFAAFQYLASKHRPLAAVTRLSIQMSNGDYIYDVPLEWLDLSYGVKGQINVQPLGLMRASSPGGSASLPASTNWPQIIGGYPWTPALWTLECIAGWPDGLVPVAFNDLIGCIAAQEILSQLAATHAQRTSTSIGIDGVSESASGPGPQVYKLRMDELTEKRRRAMRQCRVMVGNSLFTSDF